MKKIEPKAVYFIKLGSGGLWEQSCIEEDQTIRLGFNRTDHKACLCGDWEKVRNDEIKNGRKPGKATQIINQIKRFYEEGEETLWITFYGSRMWWCFTHKDVKKLPDGSKVRKVIGQWRDTDINGRPLSLETLSGRLTQVRGFRGTICSVDCLYVENRINDITSLEVSRSIECLNSFRSSLIPLIQNLTWKDFELLVDLIFSNAGWQRIGELGKTEKSIDLDLRSPVTRERVMVQIKAVSDKKRFEYYCKEFLLMKDFEAFFYVVHTPKKSLTSAKTPARTRLIFGEELAKMVIDAGLAGWLIDKNR